MLPLPVKVEGVWRSPSIGCARHSSRKRGSALDWHDCSFGTFGHIGRHRQWATAPRMSNIIVNLGCGGVGRASRIIGVCRIGTIGNYRSLASMPLASIKQWCFLCRAIDFTV